MSDTTKNTQLSANGWSAVPRSFKKSLAEVNKDKQAELALDEANPPTTDIAKKTHAFAKKYLPEKTFNHSMRVWYYGNAIIQTHFPHLEPLLETYYLTCLLHDIATTAENMQSTHMSFEYYGAFKALNFLRDNGASTDQAEAVSEAIIRHADLGETGTLTRLGMMIQLSTVFDNIGLNPHLISRTTIARVVAAFPRGAWSSCFAETMRLEMQRKPWCHTTANEGFVDDVLGNHVMAGFE